jgi:hypothetical protein
MIKGSSILVCNLQTRVRTHAVLMIGLYELLGNPTTLCPNSLSHPSPTKLGRWFSPGTPASSTTKTGHHDIAESGIKNQKSKSTNFVSLLYN